MCQYYFLHLKISDFFILHKRGKKIQQLDEEDRLEKKGIRKRKKGNNVNYLVEKNQLHVE